MSVSGSFDDVLCGGKGYVSVDEDPSEPGVNSGFYHRINVDVRADLGTVDRMLIFDIAAA